MRGRRLLRRLDRVQRVQDPAAHAVRARKRIEQPQSRDRGGDFREEFQRVRKALYFAGRGAGDLEEQVESFDERPEDLTDEVAKFSVIAVDFPKFTDGRGYSIAYNLRERLGYQGMDSIRPRVRATQVVASGPVDHGDDRGQSAWAGTSSRVDKRGLNDLNTVS